MKIRKGKEEDLPSVLKLINLLAEYENSKEEVSINLEELKRDGFGKNPLFKFLIAEIKGEIVGLSLYFIRYSTWKGKVLYLEDFVIKKEYRKLGIGSKLFKETIKICHELELNGMSWQVLDWNNLAIEFYEKFNSTIQDGWLNGSLTKNQIHNFMKK